MKHRKYLIDLLIPKQYYRLLEEVANKLGLNIKTLVEQSLQEYFAIYVVPIVQHLKR